MEKNGFMEKNGLLIAVMILYIVVIISLSLRIMQHERLKYQIKYCLEHKTQTTGTLSKSIGWALSGHDIKEMDKTASQWEYINRSK